MNQRGGGSDGTPTTKPDRKPPKVISPSDPSSAWTAKANKRVQFGYGLNYLIDVEHAVIVDVEPTPARTFDEVASTKTMLERTEERLDLRPDWLAADTAYGTGKLLAWLLGKNIAPHIPVWERDSSADGMFSRSEFFYDGRILKVMHALATVEQNTKFDFRFLTIDLMGRVTSSTYLKARTGGYDD